MHSIRVATLTTLTCLAALSQAQADPTTIDRIIDQGKNHSQLMKRLTYLCTKVGPRLTGSPELTKGEQWAMDEFRRMGLTNVHLDEWGETPVGFDRGSKASARIVAPEKREMVFTTPCWTNGTNGKVKADAILGPASVEEIDGMKDRLTGKWVVLPSPTAPRATDNEQSARQAARAAQAARQAIVDALGKLPIAGVVTGSRNELVVTAGRWTDKTYENHPGVPQVLVRKSDYDQILADLASGKTTTLEIQAENRWYPGPVKQYNVVADIPGTEKPDEIVIVSGHFDSWNGPGSQGCNDNGTGSMTAMEAARILMATGAKPKRTIRFILWSGEEQGLYGSAGYVKNHPDELPKISAVLVDDGGTGYQAGYVGIASQKEIMESAFAPVVKAFPDMPQTFSVNEHMPRGGGSDHASFNAKGVPGFFTKEGGNVDYTFVHHTQHDNLKNAVPKFLVQSATNHAVVAYTLACLPDLLPRDTPPAEPSGTSERK